LRLTTFNKVNDDDDLFVASSAIQRI